MSLPLVEIELTNRQVELLIEYACPFEDEGKQLEEISGKSGDFHVLQTDDFYAPLLIGDLLEAAKGIQSDALFDELEELWDIIDTSIQMAKNK